MMVELLFLAVPGGCLQFVIVVFPDHTHYFLGNFVLEIHKVQIIMLEVETWLLVREVDLGGVCSCS